MFIQYFKCSEINCNNCGKEIKDTNRFNAVTIDNKIYHDYCYVVPEKFDKHIRCSYCKYECKFMRRHHRNLSRVVTDEYGNYSMMHNECILNYLKRKNRKTEKNSHRSFLKQARNLTLDFNHEYLEKIKTKIVATNLNFNNTVSSNIDYFILMDELTIEYEDALKMIHAQYLVSKFKKELIEKVFHPSRFQKWSYDME